MTKAPKISLKDRILHADTMASRYLGDANEASESGAHKTAQILYDKSQFWLDRYNLLTNQSDKAAPSK